MVHSKTTLLKSLYQIGRLTCYSVWLKRFLLFWNNFNGPIQLCPLWSQESSFRLGSNFLMTFQSFFFRTILRLESPFAPFGKFFNDSIGPPSSFCFRLDTFAVAQKSFPKEHNKKFSKIPNKEHKFVQSCRCCLLWLVRVRSIKLACTNGNRWRWWEPPCLHKGLRECYRLSPWWLESRVIT